jgi:hypothetical protein
MQRADFEEAVAVLVPPATALQRPASDLGTVWLEAYEAARAADTIEDAAGHYDIAAQAEAAIAALPPSLNAARLALRAAVRIMTDEQDEPSYAPLIRAALRQIEGAQATAPPPLPMD